MNKILAPTVTLKLLQKEHARVIFQLVDESRASLRQWLPWVDATRAVTDTESFLDGVVEQHRSGKGPQYAICWQSDICGVCGFHALDEQKQSGSVGYWLGERFRGRGIMTEAVRQLIAIGFDQCRLSRIEITCATENRKSRAIPERLGFYYEGVVPAREWLNDRYVDHALYSLLAEETPESEKLG